MKKSLNNEDMTEHIRYLFKTVRIPHSTNDTIRSTIVKEQLSAAACLQLNGKMSSPANRMPSGTNR